MMRKHCETGLYGRIVGKKPLLRKQNNVKRLQWAKAHKAWTIEQWNKVFWTDKSKFKIFGLNRRIYMWWRVGERAATSISHQPQSVEEVLLWWVGGRAKSGICPQMKGKLNQIGYHSKLQHHAIPSGMQLMGQGFVLMQDNDLKHTSKLC